MLELDILLARFWEQFGAELSAADGNDLEKLLEYEDNDLLKSICDNEADETASRVLQMLRAA